MKRSFNKIFKTLKMNMLNVNIALKNRNGSELTVSQKREY